MIPNPTAELKIYVLNVGQGDCTVAVSPQGYVCIIDAIRPAKLIDFLDHLGNDGNIELLVVTHPHSDHFSGANKLVEKYKIDRAILAPFWHDGAAGPASYRSLLNRLHSSGTRLEFLSGYSRVYPDQLFKAGTTNLDHTACYFEFLGPTNAMIKNAEAAKIYNVNHLTIISRISWKKFRMVVAGDAQMENWSAFDSERLMEENCQVLRTAHHGSSNGTQWERISRFGASYVIISSDPSKGHSLPDLASSAVFAKYNKSTSTSALITKDTGTLAIISNGSAKPKIQSMGENVKSNVDLSKAKNVHHTTNATDWVKLLNKRISEM